MPVLRLPQDDTLANTLGGLGQSLAQNFNPINQLRGQEMQQTLQQQRFELQKQQTIDAANANAASVYQSANPHGLNDADLAATAAQIRNGNYNPSQTIEAVKAAGGYAANQAAAGMVDAAHPDWSDAQRASAKSDILSGRKNLSEVENDVATSKLSTAKTGAAIDASSAASTAATQPGAPSELGPLAKSAALSDPKVAEALAATARTYGAGNLGSTGGNMYTDPTLGSAVQNLTTDQRVAGIAPTAGQAPTIALQPQVTAIGLGGDVFKTQAAPRAPGQIVAPVGFNAATGQVSLGATPTPGGPQPPASGDTTGNQTVTPPTTTPPPPGTVQVPGVGPNTSATAATTTAEAQAKTAADVAAASQNKVNDFAAAQLQNGIGGITAAQKVQTGVNHMRQLADIINNVGPQNQIPNAIAQQLYDRFGLTVTQGQSAREVFNNYVAALMGDWRKDEGIQRLALPEIQLGQLSLPSAGMDKNALDQALDAVEARSQLGEKAGRAALKYYTRQDRTMAQNANDYFTEQAQIYDPKNDPTSDIRRQRETQSAASAARPAPGVALPALKPDPDNPGKWLHLDPKSNTYFSR